MFLCVGLSMTPHQVVAVQFYVKVESCLFQIIKLEKWTVTNLLLHISTHILEQAVELLYSDVSSDSTKDMGLPGLTGKDSDYRVRAQWQQLYMTGKFVSCT